MCIRDSFRRQIRNGREHNAPLARCGDRFRGLSWARAGQAPNARSNSADVVRFQHLRARWRLSGS
eukprot:14880005-Alexandrium_andersonii.AAC.1